MANERDRLHTVLTRSGKALAGRRDVSTKTKSINLLRLGNTIQRWREDEGWTQTQLSQASGYSANRISEIERGIQKPGNRSNKPGKRILINIALALKKDPIILLRLAGHDLDFGPELGPVNMGLLEFLSRRSPEQQRSLLTLLTSMGRNGIGNEPPVGAKH